MLLLGKVIEAVSGESYFDYVRKRIFSLAGMRNTDSYEKDDPVENLAMGYMPTEGQAFGWKNNSLKGPAKGGSAGGGYSTVLDLHRFACALFDPLSQSTENTVHGRHNARHL